MIRRDAESVPLTAGGRAQILRWRVADQCWRMLVRGTIERPHWIAVERWRDDMALMLGVSDRDPLAPRCPSLGGITEAMLDAADRVAGGWDALAPHAELVRWVVLSQRDLRAWERQWHRRHGAAGPEFVAALDRLARYYTAEGG